MIFKLKKMTMDKYAIAAALKRARLSYKKMAAESGFSHSSLNGALKKPLTNANKFIAAKLGKSVHELWPDWFDADGDLIPSRYREKLSKQRQQAQSQEADARNGRG